MANSQIDTSKNPSSGASTFIPRATKMVRRVDRVTTHTSARKMNAGSQGLKSPAEASANTLVLLRVQGAKGAPTHRPGRAAGQDQTAAGRYNAEASPILR